MLVYSVEPRTIYDKDVCRVYSSGNSYGALHSLSNNSRDTQTTEDDCYDFDAFKKVMMFPFPIIECNHMG